MKHALLLSLLVISTSLSAQFNTYYVGHSLISPTTPWMIKQLRIAAGTTTQYRHHINNGASLHWQWDHPTDFNIDPIWNPSLMMNVEHGTDFLVALDTGASPAYKRMVITESVPITNNPNDTTGKYGKYFHDLAKTHDATIKNFMLQTWEHQAPYGTWAAWRTSINTLLPNWEAKVDKINTPSTSNNMFIIPGGLAMGALYDTLQLGAIGPLTQISQIFSDDIHLNADGIYFIACVIYACIYQQSPVGLPPVTFGPYNNSTSINDPTVRAKLQQIAWVVASSYPRSGFPPLAVADLSCFSVKETKEAENISLDFCLAPSTKKQNVDIQFSLDGSTFHTLHQLQNIGEGEYRYTYQENHLGNLYYRLQFDDNGHTSYSNIISLYLDKDEIKLTPNPASQYIRIENADENAEIKVYNSTGQIMFESKNQDNKLDVSSLNNGIYLADSSNKCNLSCLIK